MYLSHYHLASSTIARPRNKFSPHFTPLPSSSLIENWQAIVKADDRGTHARRGYINRQIKWTLRKLPNIVSLNAFLIELQNPLVIISHRLNINLFLLNRKRPVCLINISADAFVVSLLDADGWRMLEVVVGKAMNWQYSWYLRGAGLDGGQGLWVTILYWSRSVCARVCTFRFDQRDSG